MFLTVEPATPSFNGIRVGDVAQLPTHLPGLCPHAERLAMLNNITMTALIRFFIDDQFLNSLVLRSQPLPAERPVNASREDTL